MLFNIEVLLYTVQASKGWPILESSKIWSQVLLLLLLNTIIIKFFVRGGTFVGLLREKGPPVNGVDFNFHACN